MNRLLTLAVLLPFVGALTSQACLAQEGQARSPIGERFSKLLESKAQQPSDGDSDITKLLKARYNEALSELNAIHDGVMRGSFTSDKLFDSGRRLLDAELDLSATAADRTATLKKTIAVIEEFEKKLQVRVEANVDSPADLHRLRYERLGLAVDLLRLKEK